jgi:hypothetical protein
LNSPSSIVPASTIFSSAGEVELPPNESAALGLPVTAPSGTIAFTEPAVAEVGSLAIRPSGPLNLTCSTFSRWRPVSSTLEPSAALRSPAH